MICFQPRPFQNRLGGNRGSYLYRQPCISTLPTLLAPLLGDSPCLKSATRARRDASGHAEDPDIFSAVVFNDVMRSRIAPLVDLGWFCTTEVEKTLHALLKAHTNFRHLTEDKVFREIAIIPLMFGHLSAGLRQRCIREILVNVLFGVKGGEENIPFSCSESMYVFFSVLFQQAERS